MAKNILVTVDIETARAQQAMAELNGEVVSLGKALQQQTEDIHDFRSGVDDAVEQLNLFGDAGAALVGEINKIADPMKRLALANDLAAKRAGIFSSASQKLSDTIQAQRVKLIAAVGGVEKYEQSLGALKTGFGLALAGVTAFAGFIGGAGVAAVNKFVEADRKTSNALKEMSEGFDDLLYTFGNAAVGGDNLAVIIDKITAVMKDLTTEADNNRSAIFDASKAIVVGLTYVVEWVAKAGYGVYGFFQVVVDSLQELFRQGFLLYLAYAEKVSEVFGFKLNDDFYALKLTVETDNAFAETERIAENLEKITKQADEVRAFFGDSGPLNKPVTSAPSRPRVRSGGARAKAPSNAEITFTEEEGLATKYDLATEALTQFQTSAVVAGSSIQATAGFVQELGSVSDITAAALQGATKGTEAWQTALTSHASVWAGFAGSFVATSAQIVSAMAGQGGAWRAWEAAGLGAIASVADYYANFLFGIAAGELFINPALSAAAFAGGLLLKGVSGALAGKADKIGNPGTGQRGSTTATTSAARQEVSREAQSRDQVINLYIDGNRVTAALIPSIQRLQRNGQLNLSTR